MKKHTKIIIKDQTCHVTLSCGATTMIDAKNLWIRDIFPYWSLTERGYVICSRIIKTEYGAVNETRSLHWLIVRPQKGFVTDHVSRNKLDNREVNLRLATKSQNAVNSKKKVGASKFRGVSKSHSLSRPWRAYLRHDYKQLILGYFKTEEEAARAYDKKAREIRGPFVSLNFP